MKRQTWRSFVVFSIILVLALNMVCFLHFVLLVHAEDISVQMNTINDIIEVDELGSSHPPWDEVHNWHASTTYYLGLDNFEDFYYYGAGIRFNNVAIPNGATIDSAVVSVYAAGSQSGSTVNLRVCADDADNATVFTGLIADYNGRSRTDYVAWSDLPSWTGSTWYNSSDISSVIQTIVDRGGWLSGNSMVIFLEDATTSTDFRLITSYDVGPVFTNSPKLYISYTAGDVAAEDYVDSQTNVDSSVDKGTHSSFTAQKATDWTNDSLIEANTNTTALNNAENFVDANNSDIDSHTGHGTSSNFTAQQDANVLYNDTLTEANTAAAASNTTVFNNGFEVAVWNSLFDQTSGTWILGTNSTPGSPWVTHSGTNMTYCGSTNDGSIYTDDVDMRTATKIYVTFWYMDDDCDGGTDFQFAVYDGASYDAVADLSDSGTTNEDVWRQYSWTSTDSQYFDSTFRLRFSATPESGEAAFIDDVVIIREVTPANNYELDYEFSWTTASFSEANEYLCIRTSTFSGTAENLGVDVWDGSWKSISNALTASQWNNISISSNLTGATIYFRFIGKTETTDPNQNTWNIECNLIHTWSVGVNYELDLEEQFTTANFSRTSVELCVRMGAYNTTENIRLDYWNASASAWIVAVATLTTNVWNNVSVKTYTSNASVTFTIRFLGTSESGDSERSMWDKDACLLHTWDAAGAGLAVVVSQSILVPAYNALAKGLGFQSSDLIIPTSTGYFWKSLPFQVTGAIQAFASTNLAKALSFLSSGVTGFFSSMAKAFCLNFQPTVSVVPSSTNYFLKALGFQSTNTVQSFGSVTLQKALGFLTSGTSNLFASLSKASALSFQSGNSIIPSGTSYLSRALGFQSSALLVPSSVSYFGKALGFQATDMMRVFESTSMLKSVGFLSTELINIFDFSAFSKEVGFQVLEVQRAENVFPSATTYFWKAIGFQTIGTINLYDLTSVGKGLGFLTSGIMSGVSSFQNGVALMFESSGSIKLWDSSGMLKALGYQTTASTNLFATSGMSKAIGLFSSGSFQIYDYSSMLKGLSFQSANSIIPSAATTFLKGLGFQNTGSIIPTSTTSLLKGLSFQNLVGINLFDTSQFLKAIGLLTTGTIYPSGHLLSNNALAFNPTATINLFSHNLFGKEIATLFYDIVKPFETLGFWKALGFQSSEMIGMFGTNFFGKGLLFQTSQSINLFGNMQALKEQLFTILNVFNYEPIFPSATLIENKAVQFSVVGEIPKLFSSFSSNLGREFFNYDLILPLTYTSQSRGLQFGFDGVITAFTDSALGKATGFLVSGITNIYSGILKAVGLAFQPSGVFRVWDSNGVLKALGFQASGSVNVFSFNSIMNALGFQVDANVKLLDSSNMMKALGFLTTDTFKLFDSLSYSFEIWQYIPQDFYFTLTDITKMFSSLSFNMAKGFNNYNVIYPSGFLIQNKALGFNFDGLLRLFSDVSLGIEKGFSNFGTVNPFSYLTKNKALGFNAYDLLFAFDNLGMAKGIRITVFDFLNTGLIHVSDSLTMAKSVFIAFAENLFGNLNIQGLMIPIGQILLLRPGGFGIADDTYEILFGFCFVMLVVVFGYGLSRREKEDETF